MAEISVVIPAYNAERTLERAVRSVLGQTLRELEVWITDDGSTDRTGEIADRLAAEDTRVHVIHQANAGAYQARFNALKRITTPYFGFVDADDTIKPEMFEKMLDLAKRKELDVVQVGWQQTGVFDLGLDDCLIGEEKIYQAYVKPVIWEGRDSSFIWDKLYRNQYDFSTFDPTDHVTNFDDLIFNLQFFTKVNRMGFIDEPLYHYNETLGSAARRFKWKLIKDFRETLRMRRKMAAAYGVHPWGWMNFRWFVKNSRNIVAIWLKGLL